jgi:hypothetical protein
MIIFITHQDVGKLWAAIKSRILVGSTTLACWAMTLTTPPKKR